MKINFRVKATILDNKTINIIMEKNFEMNKLDVIRGKSQDEKMLELRLTLHCWIQIFEYILHLGVKITSKSFMQKLMKKNFQFDNKSQIKNQFWI